MYGDQPHPRSADALRGWVRAEIRAQIASGALHPGSRILEREIADTLTVSRVPVREAFRLLEAEGYLVSGKSGGVRVRPLDADEVNEMFDVRVELEALAARSAAVKAPPAQINDLCRQLEGSRHHLATGHLSDFAGANSNLHSMVRAASGNRFLGDRVGPLIGRVSWAFQVSSEPELVLDLHTRLITAIAEHRFADAEAVMREDTEHNRRVALTRLEALHDE
ncbi:GntR family transcriptional regulator [Corynebacterium glyciniphilum]|uniref:GntR family transcriptional regulator n=1 Tax=Corynebacterium glyciniphilum TaxID=1404244 RepID=UPI003DA068E9